MESAEGVGISAGERGVSRQNDGRLFHGDFIVQTERAVAVAKDDTALCRPFHVRGVPLSHFHIGEARLLVEKRVHACHPSENGDEHGTGHGGVRCKFGFGYALEQSVFIDVQHSVVVCVAGVHVNEGIVVGGGDFAEGDGDGAVGLDVPERVFPYRADVRAIHENGGDFIALVRGDHIGDVVAALDHGLARVGDGTMIAGGGGNGVLTGLCGTGDAAGCGQDLTREGVAADHTFLVHHTDADRIRIAVHDPVAGYMRALVRDLAAGAFLPVIGGVGGPLVRIV